ncbi:MAG: MAPEG family protein [Deltaproteobacteria bacterium]
MESAAQTFAGPILVTLAYLLLYYVFQLHIMRVKGRLVSEYKARGEKFDRYFGQDRHMLAADRIQLNMLEHMPPFLVLLWLAAVFVEPVFATVVGGVYVAARALYPFLMGARLGRGIQARILIATVTGYLALLALMGGLLWRMVFP